MTDGIYYAGGSCGGLTVRRFEYCPRVGGRYGSIDCTGLFVSGPGVLPFGSIAEAGAYSERMQLSAAFASGSRRGATR